MSFVDLRVRRLSVPRPGRAGVRWVLSALLVAVSVGLWLPGVAPAAAQSGLVRFPKATLVVETDKAEHRFKIEVARDHRQQAQGLMFRRRLARDAGMLFIYRPVQPVSMWMRNTLIPLDMIIIDADRRVSHIVERTVPLSEEAISSRGPVLAVLELNAGTASRLGIKPGHKVVTRAMAGD